MSETIDRPIQQILNDLVKNIGSKENYENSITELEAKLKKYEDNDFNKFIGWLKKDSKDNNKILRSLSDDPESYAMFKNLNSVLVEYDKKRGVTDAIDTKKSMSARFLVTIGTFDQKKQEEIDKKNQEIDKKAQDIIDGIQKIKDNNGVYSYEMAMYIKNTFDDKKIDKEVISKFCDKFNNLKQTSWTPEEHHGFKMGLFNQNGRLFSDDFVKLETDAARVVRNENEGNFEFVKRSSLAIIDNNKLTMFVLNLNNGCDEKTPCKQRTLNQMKPIIEGQIDDIFKQGEDIKLSLGDKKKVCNEIVEDVINSFRDNVNVQGVAQSSDGLDIDLEDKQQILSGYVELSYEKAQKMELQKQLEALGKKLDETTKNYNENTTLTSTQKEQIEKYKQQFSAIQNKLQTLLKPSKPSNPEIETPASSAVRDNPNENERNKELNVSDLNEGSDANELDTTVDGVIGLIANLQEQLGEIKQQLQDKQNELSERLSAEETLDNNYENQLKIIQSLELENKRITDQLNSTLDEFKQLRKVADKSDDRKRRLEQAIAIGEGLQQQNKLLTGDNTKLNQQLRDAQAQLTAEQQKTEKLEATVANQTQQLGTARTTIKNQADQLAAEQEEKQRQAKTISELTTANESQAGLLRTTQDDNETLKRELGTAQTTISELKTANTDQQQQISQLTGENDTLNQQLRDAQAQLAAEQQKTKKLEATVKDQADQFENLNAGYQGLNQSVSQISSENVTVKQLNVAQMQTIEKQNKTIKDLQNDVANAEEARLRAVGESNELRAKLEQSESLSETLQNSRDRSLRRASNAREANEELTRENRFQKGQITELEKQLIAEQQKNEESKTANARKEANLAMTQAVIKFLSTEDKTNKPINNLMDIIGDNIVNCDTDILEFCLDRLEGKIQLNGKKDREKIFYKITDQLKNNNGIDDETKQAKSKVLDGFQQKLEEQEKNQNTGKYNSGEISKAVKGYCKNIEQNQGQENPEAEEQLINSIQNHIDKCGVNGLKTALEPLKNIGGLKQDQYKNLIEGLNSIAAEKTIPEEKKKIVQEVVSGLKNKQEQKQKEKQLQNKEQQLEQVEQELAEVRKQLGLVQDDNARQAEKISELETTNKNQAETIAKQQEQLRLKAQELQRKEQVLAEATEQLQLQQQKIKEQEQEIKRQQADLTKARDAKAQLEKQIETQKENIKTLTEQLGKSNQQINDLNGKIKGIDDEKTKLAEQGRELAEQIKALSTTIEQTKQDNEEALEKKQGEINGLREDLKSKQEKISGLEATNSTKDATLAQQEEDLKKLRGELNKIQQEQLTKDEESQRLSAAKEQLEQSETQLKEQLQQEQQQIAALTEQNNAQSQKVNELQRNIEDLKKQNRQQSEQLQQQLKTQKQTYEQRINTLTEQNNEQGQQVTALQEDINKLKTDAQNTEDAHKQELQRREQEAAEKAKKEIDAVRAEEEAKKTAALEAAEQTHQNKITELTRQHRQNKQQLLKKNQRLQQQIEQNEAQKQTYEQQIKNLNKEKNDLTSRISHQREELNRNGKKFEELQTKLQQTKEIATNAQQENTELRNNNAAMIRFLTDWSKQYTQQSTQLAAKEKRLKEVEKALKNAQKAQREAEQREQEVVEKAEAEKTAELGAAEQTYQQQLQQEQAKHAAELETQKQTYEQQIDELTQQYRRNRQELLRKNQRLQKQFNLQTEQKIRLQRRFNASKATSKKLARRAYNLLLANKAKNDRLKQLEERNQQLQDQLETQKNAHQKEIDDKNAEIDAVKAEAERQAQDLILGSFFENVNEMQENAALEAVQQQKQMEQYRKIAVQAAEKASQKKEIDRLKQQNQQHQHQLTEKQGEIAGKDAEIARQKTTIDNQNTEIAQLRKQVEQLQKEREQHRQLQEQVEKEQVEKTVKTIKLKVGNDEFDVELNNEGLADSFNKIFGDKRVEVANIFEKANKYVDGLEKEENQKGLDALYGVLDGLSGDNTKLKIAVMRDETTLKEFVAFDSNLKGKCREDSDIYQNFRKALLKEFTIIREIVNGMKNANILDMELVKDNTVDKGVQTEATQNEVGVQTVGDAVQTQTENVTPANSTGVEDGVEVSTLKVQRNKKIVKESDKNVETQPEQPEQQTQPTGQAAILNMNAQEVVNDKNKGNQQDSTAQKLSAQKQLTQALNNANETTQKNNPAEKSETFVYYKCIQKKEGKEEDIGLKTELGKGDVKDVTFPIELQIESKKATLGEVVAYAKSVLESMNQEVNSDNVMKMLDLQGQGIREEQLKKAKESIAKEIENFAGKGVGLTEEKLREEADKNQSYSQVVDRIAERAEQIAQLRNGELRNRITNKVRQGINADGPMAQKVRLQQQEARSKQPASLQK